MPLPRREHRHRLRHRPRHPSAVRDRSRGPRLAVGLAIVAALSSSASPLARAEEIHTPAPPVRALPAPTPLATDAAVTADALTPRGRRIATALSCACFVGASLRIDPSRALADPACNCPFADRVRADVADVAARAPGAAAGAEAMPAAASAAAGAPLVALALHVEQDLLPRSPEYERLLRYDDGQYRWFLENVRCTCEGCKATVYFSNCQLTCAPAIVYKRRARVFLALGLSVEALLDHYQAEHNATHPPREQVTRADLLPRRQKQRGWLVPALAIGGAALGLAWALARVVRRGRGVAAAEAAVAGVAGAGPALTAAERAAMEQALEDLEER